MPKVKSVKAITDPDASLRDIVILQKTIQEVSDFAKKLNDSGLKREAVVVLLQQAIGTSRIPRVQINDVLDGAQELGKLYLK